MTNTYTIGRERNCHIVPNATDKPIELFMHHFNARSLIINLKTGDVLSHLFSDSHHTSAQSEWKHSAISQLEHNIFMEQDGEKVLFMLRTNYNSPAFSIYVDTMVERGVTFGGEIISDIENDYSEYDKYRYGEIYTGFIIDLNNPENINVSYSEEAGQPLQQTVVASVGNEKSTLPNIDEQINLYFTYSGIGKLIAHAEESLENQLDKTGIDLSDLSSVSGHIADAITLTMSKERPFSSSHLYKEEYSDCILNTLSLVNSKGMDSVVVSSLCGAANNELASRILRINEFEEGSSLQFFQLVSLAQKLFPFSLSIVSNQENEETKDNCYMQMQDSLTKLQKVILIKIKHFEFDQATLANHNIKMSEDFLLPETITE